ncbi:MAG TPA: aquaporin [Candidatus Andersenbacteria bacterium]|nr:aquaporin [Candidatus Andersenbacteria bacterium]
MNIKKYIAEGLGAGVLTLMVALSLRGIFIIPTPVIAALTLGLFVYTIGHLSGAHINPAVTIGAWSIKQIDSKDAVLYIISQCIGAGIAILAANMINPVTVQSVPLSNAVFLAELVGTFLFTFGIASVMYAKNSAGLSGFVIGGSLLLGIICASLFGSFGILNPAVALGVGAFNVPYIFGPIVGSILGMNAYKYLCA